MKGKSWSIPFGMIFKKYYCSKCGTKLEKEKTHRVVTKNDKDYYQYHDYGMYPRYDYNVYEYRFKCPKCNERRSFKDQCIIEKIQKKYNIKILSINQIKDNYNLFKEEDNKRALSRNIIIPIVMYIIFFVIYFFTLTDRTLRDFGLLSAIFMFLAITTTISIVRNYKGKGKIRIKQSYSHEHITKMKKLHTYASNNKNLIEESNVCYCFCCKKIVDKNEIKEYIDEDTTALCPNCGVDSVIPDSIDEELNGKVIDDLNNYWF